MKGKEKMNEEIDLSEIDGDPTNNEGALELSPDYFETVNRRDHFDTDDFESLVDMAGE